MWSKEAEVVFTFTTANLEEKAAIAVVLQILTNQITTTFQYKTACFPCGFCLYTGVGQILFNFFQIFSKITCFFYIVIFPE